MCFSASASVASAIVLIPTGIYSLIVANKINKSYWAIAILPLVFGVQQIFEAGVWIALTGENQPVARVMALGFLLCSHVFWLGWIGYSSYLIESSVQLKRLFFVISLLGIVFGISMYVPLLIYADWLVPSIINHSVNYDFRYWHDEYISQKITSVIYASIVLLPLLLSSVKHLKWFGFIILFSGMSSWAIYSWAFVSVWCYFSAIMSLYVFFMIKNVAHATQ